MKTIDIFFILFVLVLAIAIVWALQLPQRHDFENKCFDCHVGLKDPSILIRDADFLCLGCHPEQKNVTHPIGFIPTKNIPSSFPLYRGKMLCITCHIAHKTYAENNTQQQTFDNNPFLLRVNKIGRAFCYQCHNGGADFFLVNKTDSHALAFQKAHGLSHDISLKEVLDQDSQECLSCHDGTLSRDSGVQVAGITWEHAQGIGSSHPIGINYRQVYLENPGLYRPLASLDPRIKLLNGKIGCQTCHMHYSKIPHLLVMENKRSRLCLQCHDL